MSMIEESFEARLIVVAQKYLIELTRAFFAWLFFIFHSYTNGSYYMVRKHEKMLIAAHDHFAIPRALFKMHVASFVAVTRSGGL